MRVSAPRLASSHVPDLGTAVLEELQELGNEDVEGSIEGVRVEGLRRVLADLLEGPKRTLEKGNISSAIIAIRLVHNCITE